MCVCVRRGVAPDKGMGERTRVGWEETGSRDEGMDRDEPTSECVEGVRLIRWYGEGHPEGSVCAGLAQAILYGAVGMAVGRPARWELAFSWR